MAFVPYPNNYNFHEETLSDRMVEVKNTSGRKVLHNELVLIDGYFGEVCEFDGIENGARGFININPERTIKTTQVKDTLDDAFTPGNPVYFIPQTGAKEGLLTDTNESSTAIAVGMIVSADEDNGVWVVFRPYVQDVGVSLMRDPDTLLADMVAAAAKPSPRTAEIVIDDDATGTGIDVTLDDIGMEKGDIILDVAVLATTSVSGGTLQLKHGDSGDAITSAIVCAVEGTVAKTATLTKVIATDDGFTVVANGAADAGVMYITFLKG